MVSQLHVNGDPSDLSDHEFIRGTKLIKTSYIKGTNNDIVFSELLNSIVTITFGCK